MTCISTDNCPCQLNGRDLKFHTDRGICSFGGGPIPPEYTSFFPGK